jgi:hypothetical protein
LLISAVIADPWYFQVAAVAKISTPALATRVVVTAVPAHSDTLPVLPPGDARSKFIDNAGDFMSGYPGILNARPGAIYRERVAVANPTGLHFDPNLPFTWLLHLALDDLKACAWLGNLRGLHLSDYDSHRCHKTSPAFQSSVEKPLQE